MLNAEVVDFILNKMPIGVIVFDQKMGIVYCNRQATNIFHRFKPPQEITEITKRIFTAIRESRLKELFPGDVYLSRKLEGSPSTWLFRFYMCEKPYPLVSVFIIEETVTCRMDMNKIRDDYRLTRKQTDVLRLVLTGLKNTEIAEDLEITEQTVKDHLSNIYMKFRVENRFELVRSLLNTVQENRGT